MIVQYLHMEASPKCYLKGKFQAYTQSLPLFCIETGVGIQFCIEELKVPWSLS